MNQVHHVLRMDNLVNIALRMLACINREAVLHSVRTAYLSYKTVSLHPMNEKCSIRNLVLLSLFHTIGFFREDIHYNYIPRQNELDYFALNKATDSKYVFSCYYLEYMTPLGDEAQCLQTFLQPHNQDLRKYLYQEEYKDIIYMCARISDYWAKHMDSPLPDDINEIAPGYFDNEYVEAFKKANKDNVLLETIKKNAHQEEITKLLATFSFPADDKRYMEKLIVHLLDFKSTSTMKHSIHTSCYSLSLGIRMNLNDDDMTTLYTSAFLHDIGKIAIPQRILESPGKLTSEDMNVMRHHVNHSRRILSGQTSDEIIETVYRHHEKLNGSGYPRHLNGNELTQLQKILTVADITSALHDSRSYKGEFSKDKTISIIKEMADNGELDAQITAFVINDFDTMLQEQQIFQNMLQVDFSKVLENYNNYIFNDAELRTELLLNNASPADAGDNMAELEELDDSNNLEEL